MAVLSGLANRSWRAAVTGVAMASALAPSAALSQERQVAASATPSAASAAAVASASRPITQEHCNILFGAAVEMLKVVPEDASTTAKAGMRNFFVNVSTGKIDCTGERQWPWATLRDTDFLQVVLDDGSGAAKVDFGRDYGVKPASRPSKLPPVIGPSSDARPAPRG